MRRARLRAWVGSLALLAACSFEPPAAAQTWTNLVQNSTFDTGSASPWMVQATGATATIQSVSVSGAILNIGLSDFGIGVTSVEVGQSGIAIEAGRSYRVTFYGQADAIAAPAQARVKVGAVLPPYASYFERDVFLPHMNGADFGETFQFTFTATSSDPNAWFGIFLGGNTGAIQLDSLYLEVMGDGPSGGGGTIHTNQLGFLPRGNKRATLVNGGTEPLAWALIDGSDNEIARGMTEPAGSDSLSGDPVHMVDFSDVMATADELRLAIGDSRSHPLAIRPNVYESLRRDALRFFYHQRASTPIDAPYAEGAQWERAAGHPDSAVPCLAGCSYTLDVSRGWYDAGDHGKYVVNGGIAVYTLLSLYERAHAFGTSAGELGDGTLNIPESDNGVPDLLDEARWELEFMLGMQVPEGQPLDGMAHHKVHSSDWTPLPTAPADDSLPRYLHPPSTAATLNLAATGAQCARVFRNVDAGFASRCLDAARRAYEAAVANPTRYAPASDDVGGGPYDDTDVTDEFYWAAAELLVTTGEAEYETAVRGSEHLGALGDEAAPFSWQAVAGLGTVSLAIGSETVAPDLLETARQAVVDSALVFAATAAQNGYGAPIASFFWGSNGAALNAGIVTALAHDITGTERFARATLSALDYVLGRNPLGQSYVTGFGTVPFRNLHHRFWARGIDPAWPSAPPGVLAGGPNASLDGLSTSDPLRGCQGPKCWRDDANAFGLTEVTVNWNAPLAWVAAWAHELGTNPVTDHPGIDGMGSGVVLRDGGASAADGGTIETDGAAPGRDGGAESLDGSSAEGDGGRTSAKSGDGCGCRLGRTAPSGWPLLASAMALAWSRRRRTAWRRSVTPR